MTLTNQEWQIQKIQQLKQLKKPNNDQKLLILLFEKNQLTNLEKKQLDILFKIEKHNDNLAKTVRQKNILQNSEKKKLRKQRDHNLYLSATTLIDCDLIDTTTGKFKYDFHAIRGGLLAIANAFKSNNTQAIESWKTKSINMNDC